MGIVNVTPDSFSDGGRFLAADAAIAHGLALQSQGAALLDVGGESTRPGAQRVDPAVEQGRVLPVVRALAASGATVSIDTMNASTALAAIDAGARIVNDVSGGLADPDMLAAVAGRMPRSSCSTGAGTPPTCTRAPRTTTSSRRSSASWSTGSSPPSPRASPPSA